MQKYGTFVQKRMLKHGKSVICKKNIANSLAIR